VGENVRNRILARGALRPHAPKCPPMLFGIATNLVHHHGERGTADPAGESRHPIEPIGDPADEALSRLFFRGRRTIARPSLGSTVRPSTSYSW